MRRTDGREEVETNTKQQQQQQQQHFQRNVPKPPSQQPFKYGPYGIN